MDNSESFSLNLRYGIQCFTLNNDGNQVIVAGKTHCDLYQIEQNQFTSKSKLALQKWRTTNNLCIMDINWSKVDSTLVAAGGSNGELYKLIITPTEFVLDSTFTHKFHDRTINKIHFHPNEPNLLLTGGQDGYIKLIDYRTNETQIASFRHDAEDKVTDIQFNPSVLAKNQFASGSESGNVFLWDIRNSQKYEKKLNLHLGNVLIDWHPEHFNKIATAVSKDKQICVHDLSSDKPTIVNTLTHSVSVVSIKWRPKKANQIATCSVGIDAHLYVWDFMRPYVPYASFDQVTNKVTNFLWRNSPKVLVASTKETIHNLNISDAIRPADYSTLVTIQMDKHGSVVFAVGVGDTKTNPGGIEFNKVTTNAFTSVSSTTNASNVSLGTTSGQSIDTKTLTNETYERFQTGSFSSISNHMNALFASKMNVDTQSNESDNNIEKFRITKSVLYFDDQIKHTRSDWFCYAANNYKFKDKSFEDLCDHNAHVALNYKKFNAYKDWMILKTIYKENKRIETYKNYQINLNNTLAALAPPQPSPQALPTANINKSDSDTNLTNLNIMTSGFQTTSNPASTLININNPNSSSSNMSSASSTASSANSNHENNNNNIITHTDNYNRVRNLSENSNDEIIVTGQLPKTLVSNASNTFENHIFHNTIANIHNTTLDNIQNEDESCYLINNLMDKFADEDDPAGLPNDIIEYNEEFTSDYFATKQLKNNININNNNNNNNEQDVHALNKINSNATKNDTDSYIKQIVKQKDKLGVNRNQEVGLLLQPVSDYKSSNEMIDNKDTSFLKIITANQALFNDSFKMDFNNYFEQLLISYVNEENDLPTAIFMFLIATLSEKFDRNKIDPTILDEWFAQYIDLLQVFEYWNLRIEIIKHYQSDLIKLLTQKSIYYNVMCSACKKTIKPNTFICSSCNNNIYLCVYCHLPVRRLYAWCNVCCHGGHLNHMIKWFKSNSKCPSGCGCKCRI